MSRKIRIEDDAPNSLPAKRKAFLDCSKEELIWAVEKAGDTCKYYQKDADKWRDRYYEAEQGWKGARKEVKLAERAIYEQMDTTIGTLHEQAKVWQTKDNGWHIAMIMVRAFETMLEEFNLANPDLRTYENASTYYGAQTFYSLCRMAKYIPKPGCRSYVLYQRYMDYDDGENYYEYKDIHDVLSDEVIEEVYGTELF